MSLKHIIESWRDEEYRENLGAEDHGLLPANPVGEVNLDEADLAQVAGGMDGLSVVHPQTIFDTFYGGCGGTL